MKTVVLTEEEFDYVRELLDDAEENLECMAEDASEGDTSPDELRILKSVLALWKILELER